MLRITTKIRTHMGNFCGWYVYISEYMTRTRYYVHALAEEKARAEAIRKHVDRAAAPVLLEKLKEIITHASISNGYKAREYKRHLDWIYNTADEVLGNVHKAQTAAAKRAKK